MGLNIARRRGGSAVILSALAAFAVLAWLAITMQPQTPGLRTANTALQSQELGGVPPDSGGHVQQALGLDPAQLAELFAQVPFPGHPEGIVTDGKTVYVGTHQDATGGPGVPSHIYAYTAHGELVRDYTITGQAPTGQGVLGLALDAAGTVYVLDRSPARVLTLDPRSGEQRTYAQLPSAAGQDVPPVPDDLTFAPDGTLYITSLTQGLIWRVPPSGGSAKIWYSSPDLQSLFGPNGIRFADHGRTLLFAQSAHELHDPTQIPQAQGRLYALTIRSDGSPGERRLVWQGQPGKAPDGFAVGRSGRVYMSLALPGALLVLSPDGREITRIPATPAQNTGAPPVPPFEFPANVAFHGENVLIANQAYFGGPAEHQAVLRVHVGECGMPLFRPRIPR